MSSKYNFTLKHIEHKNIIERYSLYINKKNTNGVTQISELNTHKSETISFINEIQNNKKYVITMMDYLTNQQLPDKTEIYCFWCRHSFQTKPIGCPIKYVPNQYEKKYFSEITKDKYVIKYNVAKTQDVSNIIEKNYYETDGVFCSFNCCLSFIEENKKNPLYQHSSFLLIKIYSEIFNDFPTKITPAPTWRLLKKYGGNLDIDEFRSTFSNISYSYKGIIREIPKFKPIGWLWQQDN